MNRILRRGLDASWLDPADGTERRVEVPQGQWSITVRPPADLDDAVLVLRSR